MIRKRNEDEIKVIADVINDGASAYKGVIPADRWQEPYMPMDYLTSEIEAGVKFWVQEDGGELSGVMGVQDVKDVSLIRHAYVRTSARRGGVGSGLLQHLKTVTKRPLLIGTWADATWAIDFYRKHEFRVILGNAKDALLDAYWSLPRRQIEESVVLADRRWFEHTA
jgi:N-acetylglutamate synthase-like GNAT family acetyltransferase